MTYIAKEDISSYKKGDVVPDDIAIVWESMYKISPVKKKTGNSSNTKKEKEEVKEESKSGFFNKSKE